MSDETIVVQEPEVKVPKYYTTYNAANDAGACMSGINRYVDGAGIDVRAHGYDWDTPVSIESLFKTNEFSDVMWVIGAAMVSEIGNDTTAEMRAIMVDVFRATSSMIVEAMPDTSHDIQEMLDQLGEDGTGKLTRDADDLVYVDDLSHIYAVFIYAGHGLMYYDMYSDIVELVDKFWDINMIGSMSDPRLVEITTNMVERVKALFTEGDS